MAMVDRPGVTIRNQGQHVPVVAFYSIQGGVGKSTLARKFAELVTVAPGRDGRRPNVLLVDLDVEAAGLTFRLTQGFRLGCRTAHEVIAERNAAAAQAADVTNAATLAGGNPSRRGRLYLLPAAPPEAKRLFDTIAEVDRQELFVLLHDVSQALVQQYDVSCVVIDCAPGANPYSAAAAELADFPLLIGRNEDATYKQISALPERFREMYPSFQPARQLVIINAVSLQERFEMRRNEYGIFDFIPLTSVVIHETEGLAPLVMSLRMLLFEKYIVDIIRQLFVGLTHLIPEPPEVLGPEWMEALKKLDRCEQAPKVSRLWRLRHLRWIGLAAIVVGLVLLGLREMVTSLPPMTGRAGLVVAVAGAAVVLGGLWTEKERHRLLRAARQLVDGGPDEVFRKLQEGVTYRRELDELKALADTIPARAAQA